MADIVGCISCLCQPIYEMGCNQLASVVTTISTAKSKCKDLEDQLHAMAKRWDTVEKQEKEEYENVLNQGFRVIHDFKMASLTHKYSASKAVVAFEIDTAKWGSRESHTTPVDVNYDSWRHLKSNPIGLEAKVEEIKGDLKGKDFTFIGVYGIGGSGKTFLAKTVADSLKDHFGGFIFWITYGKDRGRSDVLEQIHKEVEKQLKGRPGSEAQQLRGGEDIFRSAGLESREFVLVMDDVWLDAKDGLREFLEALLEETKGRVLLTSRFSEIIRSLPRSKSMKMDFLNQNDSRDLFCSYAFPDSNQAPEDLKQVVDKVVEKCGGLPLALKLMGRLMAGRSDKDSWDRRSNLLDKAQLLDEDERNSDGGVSFFRRLKLSYDALPSNSHRECFLYLAMEPQDAQLDQERFNLYWEGEGLVEDRLHSNVFAVLERYGLVERRYDGQWFVLHDIIHDLALHILDKERRGCYFNLGDRDLDLELVKFSRKNGLQRIALTSGPELPQGKLPCGRDTKALIVRTTSRIPKAFIQSFPNLKVLSLSETDLEELPSCIGKLANVVTLIVSGNSELKRIPAASIAPLTKLAHFDFSDCSYAMSFPMDALSKLKNLSFLNGRGSQIKFGGRLNMSSWPKMTHLDIWCSAASKSALSLVGIAKADALKILRVAHPLIKVKDPSSFKELVKLEEVSLRCLCQQPTWEWGQNLKRLHLSGASEETTAQGLHVVPTVEKLRLQKIHISKPFSHEFSNLEKLQLFQCFGIMRFSNLHRLWSLEIADCDEVEDMAVYSCPALRLLHIRYMRKLHKLQLVSPESCGSLNQSLPNLKDLELRGCPALSTVMPEQVTDGHDRLEYLSLRGGEGGSFLPILQQEQAPGYNAKFPALAKMWIRNSKEGVPWLPGLGNSLKTLDLECSGKGMDMFDARWLSTLSNLDRFSIWTLPSESVPGWVATLPRLSKLHLKLCKKLKGNWLPEASQNGDSYYSSLELVEIIGTDIDTASLMPRLQALVRKG